MVKPGQKKPIKYDGKMTDIREIFEFLNKYQETFALENSAADEYVRDLIVLGSIGWDQTRVDLIRLDELRLQRRRREQGNLDEFRTNLNLFHLS